ncbi:MAG: hypothetical protein ACI4Q3_07595 [Kiritimatiellia bacterium]
MKRLMLTGLWMAIAALVSADTVDSDHVVTWLADVTNGVYNDPDCWTGGEVPANGIDGKYGLVNSQSNDVTIRAPADGLVENSGTIFLGAGNGTHTLTIDTRGTFWEKKGVRSVNNWWCSPFTKNLLTAHYFNFEGLQSVDNSDRVWMFTDALFTWKSTGESMQDFDLWSGTLSLAKPLYLGSASGSMNFNIHPESTIFSTAEIQQRGNAVTHTTFLGGRHQFNGITLKDANSGSGRTWLHVTNDAVVIDSGHLSLGGRSAANNPQVDGRSTGILELSCTARMEVTNGVYLGSGNTSRSNLCNSGYVTMSGDSAFYSHGSTFLGYTQMATGVVTMLDRAVFETGGNVYFSYSSNAWGRLEMSGDTVFRAAGIFRPGSGLDGQGFVLLRDRAQLEVSLQKGNWLSLGVGAGDSYGRFEATDDTVTRLGNASSIEMTLGGTARADLLLSGNARILGGGATCVTNKSEIAGNTSVSLADAALLAVRGIYGANPASGEACMAFVADGGTLAPSSTSPGTPFMSGCAATLKAGGLTLDTRGANLTIDQAFAADATDATFVKTGSGELTVLRSSGHPRTRVEKGTLVLGAGVTAFGRKLELASGAVLALTDASSAVTADEISFSKALAIRLPADYELGVAYPVLVLGTALTAEQFAQVVVANPVLERDYAFSLSEDGTTLRVTVSAAETGTRTWTGAAGTSWNTAANWTPAGVPTHNDEAVVEEAAAITMDGVGSVGTLNVTAAAAVSVTGSDVLQVGTGVAVAPGGVLTLATPIRAAGDTAVKKDGSGTLVVAADNTGTMSGDWHLERGVTEFASVAAMGSDVESACALALSNCTFRYAGEAATVRRPWRLDGEFPAVFDIAGGFRHRRRFDVRRFRGQLPARRRGHRQDRRRHVDAGLPGGHHDDLGLEGGAAEGQCRSGRQFCAGERRSEQLGRPGAAVRAGRPLDHPGAGQIRDDGQAGASRRAGRRQLGGDGAAGTLSEGRHHDPGQRKRLPPPCDQQVRAGCPASRLVLDNADLTCNGINLGYNKVNGNADEIRPLLAITNGTLDIMWNMNIPADVGGFSPIVRVGAGGGIRRNSITVAGGIVFARKIDARFEDGGFLEVAKPQNLRFSSTANGELVFARGGRMKVTCFLAANTGLSPAVVAFDGGSAEFTLNGGISTANAPDRTSFRADAGGGELIVGAGLVHALAVPLRGTGVFTKSGAGTLVLTNDLKVTVSSSESPSYGEMGTCTLKAGNAGGIRVAEGTLVCVAGATDTSSRFSGTGTLSGSFGTSFTLDVPKEATDGLTFADVEVQTVFMDFGYSDECPAPTGTSAVVAKVPTAEAFGAIAWKARNLGAGKVALLDRDAETGVVTATFKSSGLAIYVR